MRKKISIIIIIIVMVLIYLIFLRLNQQKLADEAGIFQAPRIPASVHIGIDLKNTADLDNTIKQELKKLDKAFDNLEKFEIDKPIDIPDRES